MARFLTLSLAASLAWSWIGLPAAPRVVPAGRLIYLDIRAGRVLSASPDGSDVKVLVTGRTGIPDGVAVDVTRGHIFWTVMGAPNADDGLIDRSDLDGQHVTRIVPAGGTFTPKQLKLEAKEREALLGRSRRDARDALEPGRFAHRNARRDRTG